MTVKHPQPGFFETTVVRIRPGDAPAYDYTHEHYLAQREVTFGDLKDIADKACSNMLDAGWTPNVYGVLVKPEGAGQSERDQAEKPLDEVWSEKDLAAAQDRMAEEMSKVSRLPGNKVAKPPAPIKKKKG